MMRAALVAAAVAATGFFASSARAQTCLGLPSFSPNRVHVNAAAEFPEAAKSYAAALSVGSGGPFVNAGGGIVTYDGVDMRSTLGFVELGFQVPLLLAQVCPVAGGFLGWGPDDELFGFEQSSRGGSAGLALGLPLGGMPGLRFVPNIAVRYDRSELKVTETGVGSETYTSRGGTVDVGLAFIIAGRLSLQPLAHIPFSRSYDFPVEDDEKTTFGIFAAVAVF